MELKLEKMQFLGIFGILQEAYNIMYTWRKIISQITLFLIFPLALFFLAYNQISNHMIHNILIQIIQAKSRKGLTRSVKLSDLVLSHELAYFLLFIVVYNIFLSIVSIPSTSVITYVVAGTYTDNENKVSFKESLKIVTKVWKRVMITSFYSLGFSLTYDSVGACVLLIVRAIIYRYKFDRHIKASILIVFMAMYIVGTLYLNTIWMLSKVVSVLEESYGFKALMKSQRLLRGKMVVGTILMFFIVLSLGVAQLLYNKVVVGGVLMGMICKTVLVSLCLLLLIHFLLLKVVVLTVLYFVCKSYHRENIDMLDRHSGLVDVYVSLKTNDARDETERLLV